MKKFINGKDSFVEDSLEGVLAAYPEYLIAHPKNQKAIVRTGEMDKSRISVITGGGYGHFPLFLGYVGTGLCDGAAVGDIFSTPGANTVYQTTSLMASPKGVLYVIGNYGGDRMNFEMAAELAAAEGIETQIVLISDDVASAPREEWKTRRGVIGLIFACKIAGAAARAGMSLSQTAQLVEDANANMASYGVAFTSCQLPNTNTPVFSIGENEMELGIGIHGEPGVSRCQIMPSKEIAKLAVDTIRADISLKRGDEVAILVNGLGATSSEELYIYYRDIQALLQEYGIRIVWKHIGEYATSLSMSGAALSILKTNSQLLEFLNEPAFSPFVYFPEGNYSREGKRRYEGV
jgi:dihydroxyacetone kinase